MPCPGLPCPIRIHINSSLLKNKRFTHPILSSQPTRMGVGRSPRHRIFRLALLKMIPHRGLSTSLAAAQCGKCLVLEIHISYVDAYEMARRNGSAVLLRLMNVFQIKKYTPRPPDNVYRPFDLLRKPKMS